MPRPVKMTTAARAADLVAAIHANVDDLVNDRIDHDAFDARQIAVWDAVRAAGAGVTAVVLTAIRADIDAERRAA